MEILGQISTLLTATILLVVVLRMRKLERRIKSLENRENGVKNG